MEIFLALILLLAVLAALAYPLYNSRPRLQTITTGALGDLMAQRDGLYATLHDLDLDYQLGKLDAEDYGALREKYLSRAAVVLQELDAVGDTPANASTLDAEIEKEIAALRRRTPTQPSPVQRGRDEGRGRATLQCSNCGRAYSRGDRFCARCGQALS